MGQVNVFILLGLVNYLYPTSFHHIKFNNKEYIVYSGNKF